jgi:hypothetical protein
MSRVIARACGLEPVSISDSASRTSRAMAAASG